MDKALEKFLEIGRRKLTGTQSALNDVLSMLPRLHNPGFKPKYDAAVEALCQSTRSLSEHFTGETVPPVIARFQGALDRWRSNQEVAGLLTEVIVQATKLPEVLRAIEGVGSLRDQIDGQLEDQELQAELEKLIKRLEEIAKNTDHELSARMERDLTRIISQLRHWRRSNILDLTQWIEFAAKALAATADVRTGYPVATMCIDALKLALSSKARLKAIWDRSQGAFLLSLEMPFVANAQEKYPDFDSIERDLPRLIATSAPTQITAGKSSKDESI